MNTRPRRSALLALVLGALLVPAQATRSDDTALFSTAVPPNVLLFIDNSGSMNHMNWYSAQSATDSGWLGFAGYDPLTTYPCSSGHWTVPGQSSWTNNPSAFSRCGRTSRQIYVDATLSAAGVPTRFDNNYIRYLFTLSDANYTTLVNNQQTNGACAQSLGAPATYYKYRRARIVSARDITRNVVCDVNAVGEVRFGLAQFRKAGGSNDPNGGYVIVPVNDWKVDHDANPATAKIANTYTLNGVSKTHQQHLTDAIASLDGESWTPLGETLFQLYTYFMSRDTTKNVLGANGSAVFPQYVYVPNETGNGGGRSLAGAPTVPDSPIQFVCQKHFIVIVTDGEPTMDDFDTDANTGDNTNQGFGSFMNLIGDFNPDNALPEGGVAETVTAQNALFGSSESATFLDDIAKFAHEKDMRTDLSGIQNLDIYTVGFTTAGATNQLLQKTATAGGGSFYSSSDPSQLDDAIVEVITDIINKSQSFTAATVPASRTTDGNNFYTSYFLPGTGGPFWEGHLKNFEFTADGRILDSLGNCALSDPGAPATCEVGALLTTAPAFWDAASAMPAPASRTLYYSQSAAQQAFDVANVTAAQLGVTYPPAVAYSGSTAATNGGGTNATKAEYLTDEIVAYVRGCNFGTGVGAIACVARPVTLADIFHSNPLVVGPPNAAINDATYVAFAKDMIHRSKRLYAGSNGGFLHGFDAGTWDGAAVPPAYTRGNGAEVMAFMPYTVRNNIKNLPIDVAPRDFYYVDGPPQAADAWFYPTATSAGKTSKTEWHTVLAGGLRQGGKSYYAIDVTNPDGLGGGYPSYPSYLWEFPCEASSCDAWRPYMGETWGEPIITRVKVSVDGNTNNGKGFERWVAIVSAGYDPKGDPNDAVNYDGTLAAGTSRAGRGLFVIDLKTGGVIGAKVFDNDAASGVPGMRYAIAATPAVFDLDSDGYADVVYVGDLGGKVWKWVIGATVPDPVNGTGDVKQPAWPFKLYLQAPIYTAPVSGIKTYRSFFTPPTGAKVSDTLWLAFGSGQRNNLKFLDDATTDDDDNRFYVVKDTDPLERNVPVIPTIVGDPPDVIDIASLVSCNDLAAKYGYFVDATDVGEKFLTNSVIFLGYVFTGSFVPTVTTDPCSAGGNAYLYGIRLLCGDSAFTPPNSPPSPRRISIGAGLPNRPRTSVGPTAGGGGGGGGPCANQVLVVTSDGSAYNRSAGCLPSSGMKVDSWRELR